MVTQREKLLVAQRPQINIQHVKFLPILGVCSGMQPRVRVGSGSSASEVLEPQQRGTGAPISVKHINDLCICMLNGIIQRQSNLISA